MSYVMIATAVGIYFVTETKTMCLKSILMVEVDFALL